MLGPGALSPAARCFLVGASLQKPAPVAPLATQVDAESLVKAAERFGLVAPLYHGVLTLGLRDAFDAETLQRLERGFAVNLASHLQLLADFRLASTALGDAGVRHMPFKGLALLLEGVVATGRRHMDDIDLFVPPDQLAIARHALLKAGFARFGCRRTDGTWWDKTSELDDGLVVVGPGGTMVEVECRLPWLSHLPEGDFEHLYGLATPASKRAQAHDLCRIPSPAHTLVHLAEHVLEKHAGDHHLLPRHLTDVAALLDHSPDLEAHLAAATRPSLQRTFALFDAGMRACSAVNPDAMPPEIANPWAPSALQAFARRKLGRAARTIRSAQALRGLYLDVLPAPAYMKAYDGRPGVPLLVQHVNRWMNILRS